jgi:hypothetical protein
MKYADACKLHPGDEVMDKQTKESIRVVSVCIPKTSHKPTVIIEGVGDKEGHGEWLHMEVC